MPRFRQGDRVVTTRFVSMSAIRTYPAGTNGVIETDHRDVGPDGYIIDGAWVRITFEDTTGLCYPQTQLEHAAKEKAA